MAWWSKQKTLGAAPAPEKRPVPDGLWQKCEGCGEVLYGEEVGQNLGVCPKCGFHFALPTRDRIRLTLDEGSFTEHDASLESLDPLGFRDSKRYRDRLRSTIKSVAFPDALVEGIGTIEGHQVSVGFFVLEFMGGSMGSVVGEKVARMLERAHERRIPAVIFCASGGARMQEGILSLMQMAKTSLALTRLRRDGIPYVSVLLNPTTGGVAASFAMLGDVILAEPRALIGFAGPRVIEQTIRQKLPEGFQRSEFLLQHGMIDRIVHRQQLRAELGRLIELLAPVPAHPAADGGNGLDT
ncbi:MAG: acetyl-CoA carboxylase carboxyltransferase subunit beta [Deltaproteobacteria bacterium]|nr:acetyl-CoA carboxylase carboxyltransferase subunit beta [Deltaproteobacteria bacterium]